MAKNAIKTSAISSNNGYSRENIRFAKKSLPPIGKPNSSRDLLNPDGTLKQRRYYGPDGRATRDTDYNHADDGTHEFPHDHEWDWSKSPARQKAKGKKIMEGVFLGGSTYLVYRAVRMIPSILCPPTIIPNAIMP